MNDDASGIHLRCVGGMHYNWLIEKRSYKRVYEQNFETMDVNDMAREKVEKYLGNLDQLKVSERIFHCVQSKNLKKIGMK